MRKVTVAAVQMRCTSDCEDNIRRAEEMVCAAASKGARIILLPELFETLYFCQEKNEMHFGLAVKREENRAIRRFRVVADELKVVLPISFFECNGTDYFNTTAVIDADGSILGFYRKTHIPDGPGYEEKYYFKPGDTGFQVWKTRYGTIGMGICWDQWFPEAARCMTLLGAELLLYPTAIGAEPHRPEVDSKNHWQICMQGHAAANIIPVIAANRTGAETVGNYTNAFFGSSFITDYRGEIVAAADRVSETIITAEFDPDEINAYRDYWGLLRDRRPEMYGCITKDSHCF